MQAQQFLDPPTMYLHLTPPCSPLQYNYIWPLPGASYNVLTFDPFLEPPHSLPTLILGQQCLTLVAISLFNTTKIKMLHTLHSFFIVILAFNLFKCTCRGKQKSLPENRSWSTHLITVIINHFEVRYNTS